MDTTEYQITFQASMTRVNPAGLEENPEDIAGEVAAYTYYEMAHDNEPPDKVTVRNMNTGEVTELDPEEVVKNAG